MAHNVAQCGKYRADNRTRLPPQKTFVNFIQNLNLAVQFIHSSEKILDSNHSRVVAPLLRSPLCRNECENNMLVLSKCGPIMRETARRSVL
jgi:hypothetical protein